VTGSAALFSDAVEAIVNVVSSVMALFALRLSSLPADSNHPYGHSKVEFISAVIEGVLIVLAAAEIFRHAWDTWQSPRPLVGLLGGIGLNGASIVLNLGWSMLLLRTGKRTRSPALSADGRHLLADVVNSSALLTGVAMVMVTGYQPLDPLLAALAAIYILVAGSFLIRDSVKGLMDAAPDAEVVEQVRALVARHAAGALEAHDMRMRIAGPVTFLDFHLVVPASMTVAEAHDICDRVETALKQEMQGMLTIIHVEPEGKAKHRGVLVL
jgi:cation diffusion facilitator family transporter